MCKTRVFLLEIISSNQSAFVIGRTIVQNIVICQDLMRLQNRKNTTRSCLIKIDLRKACDTVEWESVEEILYGLNSPHSIVLDGGVHGEIIGQMGLRRGDPISPFLFVICMEYFTGIMQWVATQEGFAFHTKCKGLKLNHLCFADDMSIFNKGYFHSVMLMLRGLKTFSEASGLTTNATKSSIFSANMDHQVLEDFCETTGYTKGKLAKGYQQSVLKCWWINW
ncbi:uncharacterized protein LOC132048915 [Lycium ferocissimum]|uniref:uncharacterized protein LOC132048915 n=1 Tax=Lycium ferocissimum TaxID=112874 RepID=UPI0028160E30|nr:uncharacterized protein LOC132048915 [Lycium ferocissimum]